MKCANVKCMFTEFYTYAWVAQTTVTYGTLPSLQMRKIPHAPSQITSVLTSSGITVLIFSPPWIIFACFRVLYKLSHPLYALTCKISFTGIMFFRYLCCFMSVLFHYLLFTNIKQF